MSSKKSPRVELSCGSEAGVAGLAVASSLLYCSSRDGTVATFSLKRIRSLL